MLDDGIGRAVAKRSCELNLAKIADVPNWVVFRSGYRQTHHPWPLQSKNNCTAGHPKIDRLVLKTDLSRLNIASDPEGISPSTMMR
jgi:hypothetical protein